MDKVKEVVETVKLILLTLAGRFKSATSIHGNKELRELIFGSNTLALYMAKKFKDGVQFSDFTEFYADLKDDEKFQAALKNGYEGHKKFGLEGKDLDAGEVMEMAADQVGFVDDYVAVFKSPETGSKVEEGA